MATSIFGQTRKSFGDPRLLGCGAILFPSVDLMVLMVLMALTALTVLAGPVGRTMPERVL